MTSFAWAASFEAADVSAMQAYEDVLVPRLFTPWAWLLLDRLDLEPGEAVLDVACGPGSLTRPAAIEVGPAGRVTGVDLSAAMLAIALAKPELPRAAAIEYHHAPADRLPVDDADFDVATCSTRPPVLPQSRGGAERDAPRTAAGRPSCDRGLGRDRPLTAIRSTRRRCQRSSRRRTRRSLPKCSLGHAGGGSASGAAGPRGLQRDSSHPRKAAPELRLCGPARLHPCRFRNTRRPRRSVRVATRAARPSARTKSRGQRRPASGSPRAPRLPAGSQAGPEFMHPSLTYLATIPSDVRALPPPYHSRAKGSACTRALVDRKAPQTRRSRSPRSSRPLPKSSSWAAHPRTFLAGRRPALSTKAARLLSPVPKIYPRLRPPDQPGFEAAYSPGYWRRDARLRSSSPSWTRRCSVISIQTTKIVSVHPVTGTVCWRRILRCGAG
jgi:Methyltransferase domain